MAEPTLSKENKIGENKNTIPTDMFSYDENELCIEQNNSLFLFPLIFLVNEILKTIKTRKL